MGFIDCLFKGVGVGKEENRWFVDIFGGNWNLFFLGKVNYYWLNGDYFVIVMLMIYYFCVMWVEVFVILGSVNCDIY